MVRDCLVQVGDNVLLSGDPKRKRTEDALSTIHLGPYTVAGITAKGVATIVKGSTSQRVNLSRLRNYHRSKSKRVRCTVYITVYNYQFYVPNPYMLIIPVTNLQIIRSTK